jgi:uridine phosphorylase
VAPRPIHIHPTTDLAERVLLPGDPGRALRLAQELIDGPKMFNHHRGLWGYTGPARIDAAPLTIQSTGMGGPSAAVVIHELIELGARRLVRVGTCGGLDPTLELGQLLIASAAISDDGTSAALGASGRVPASPELLEALQEAAGTPAGVPEPPAGDAVTGDRPANPPAPDTSSGLIVSTDLFYDAEDRQERWRAAGALAVEMEAATLFALAARRDVQAGAIVIVSDRLIPSHVRIGDEALLTAEIRLGQTAVAALAAAADR